MGVESLSQRVGALSDLELAVLLCLVADQHCIIHTEHSAVDNLTEELKLVWRERILAAHLSRMLNDSADINKCLWLF